MITSNGSKRLAAPPLWRRRPQTLLRAVRFALLALPSVCAMVFVTCPKQTTERPLRDN